MARASSREQRNGDVSIARDLRSIYVHTRARASEARELRLRAAALQAQAREEAEAALEHEEPLVTFEDAGDVLGMVEAPLLVPDGFKVVAASPTEEQLDPTNPASDALIEQRLALPYDGQTKTPVYETLAATDREAPVATNGETLVATNRA